MVILDGLVSALRRLFSSKPRPVSFDPKPFGPAFEYLEADRIRMTEGEFQGQEFSLKTEVTDDEAHVYLNNNGTRVGHCDIQRNAHEATVVLWNIVVQEQLRHKGFASIIAHHAFRQMVELHKSASYGVRMLRLIKPSERITKIQNIGIGVISRKLGFAPEYDLRALLRQQNIQMIEFISSDGVMPPGYRIVLKSFPLVLIAFLVDPETGKPYPGNHRIYNSLVTSETAENWVDGRMIIIGNGNYLLRRDGVNEMINHLAKNDTEASIFARRIKPCNS